MMTRELDVPELADLRRMPLEVASADAGVVSVTGWANDGSAVTMTWDELARSVHLRWVHSGIERLRIEREAICAVDVREQEGRVDFRVRFEIDGLRGELVVRLGALVEIQDTILRD